MYEWKQKKDDVVISMHTTWYLRGEIVTDGTEKNVGDSPAIGVFRMGIICILYVIE